jgi:hypothetical protein
VYHKAVFICRILKSEELKYVKSGFLEQIQYSGSFCSKVMDQLQDYGFASEILRSPEAFYMNKSSKYCTLIRECQKRHVARFYGVGTDTVLHPRTKALGIHPYIFSRDIYGVCY